MSLVSRTRGEPGFDSGHVVTFHTSTVWHPDRIETRFSFVAGHSRDYVITMRRPEEQQEAFQARHDRRVRGHAYWLDA